MTEQETEEYFVNGRNNIVEEVCDCVSEWIGKEPSNEIKARVEAYVDSVIGRSLILSYISHLPC